MKGLDVSREQDCLQLVGVEDAQAGTEATVGHAFLNPRGMVSTAQRLDSGKQT